MKRAGVIFLVLVAAAMIAFAALHHDAPRPDKDHIEFVSAVPKWIDLRQCTEMNEEERAQQELAVKVLQVFPRISTMNIAALRHFGQDQYRSLGKDALLLCPPAYLYPAIAELTLAQGDFSSAYLYADDVRLARALGPRDPRIVEAVARTAFSSQIITTEYSEAREDIRSLARVALAEFGPAAAQWSEQAFQEIGADDALGTSAGQIAVATDHPHALERVSQLLEGILQRFPNDPIPLYSRDRFYELAFAVAAAGPQAVPLAAPILKIMNRKVESWAPPFGMLSVAPWRMCRVLELIGGPDADKALAEEACHSQVEGARK
jgi:hypothetical protein